MNRYRNLFFALLALLLAPSLSACLGGELYDDCIVDSDCDSNCCQSYSFGSMCDTPDVCAADSGSSSGGGSATGACAYISSSLNRLLCEYYDAQSCALLPRGRFFGAGTNCMNLDCPFCAANGPECCTMPGGTGGGGSTTDCSGAWTCPYDGQASPMCQWACVRTGSERAQTCQVLASMVANPADCCPQYCP